jgi:hypothetical protein
MISGTNNSSPDTLLLTLFRGAMVLVLAVGAVINYKLFDNERKDTPGEKGKVLQRIMKNYAIIQAIGWPLISGALIVLMVLLQTYGDLLNPCIYAHGTDFLIFSYILLRTYVALNSLIIAFGRYAFVVHDNQVLKFGVKKLAKILIWSSFIIPFLMSILCQAVGTIAYNGWLLEIREYERSCSMSGEIGNLVIDEKRNELYKPAIYKFVHSNLPSWATYGLKIVYIVTSTVLFSNISEGIIYIRSAVFIFK